MQLAFSPEDYNLRVGVIFQGTGKRISEDEINSYLKSVNVYWQQNAWVYTTVCVNWAKKTLVPAVKDKQDFILFCDDLEGQTALLFQEEVRKSGGITWYDVKNATDLWQPVDAGMGRLLKVLVFHEQQDWLEYDQNRFVDGKLRGRTYCKTA